MGVSIVGGPSGKRQKIKCGGL